MLLARHIGRYKARIAAQAASKTSWAAPEAPSWLRRVEHWLRPPAPSGDPLQLLPWELTSPAALEVDSSDNNDLLAYAGVVVRRNAVCRVAVAACRLRAEELASEATRRAAAAGADAGDASAGFHFADASQRGPFRLDLRLGAALDDIGDWLVHLAFFLAVGYQMTQTTGQPLWAWLGVAAALGGTINSVLPLFHRAGADAEEVASFADLSADATWVDLVGFFFRGLVKADFWLIVLALALADMLWVLLPAAAVGSQVFWMLMLRKSLRTVHT